MKKSKLTAAGESFPEYHPYKSRDAKEKFLKMYEDMAEQWPVQSKTCMVDTSYGKTFVRISGPEESPPLVLLHGIATNSLIWIPQVKPLSGYFRTYAIDNIYDFGRSIYTKPVSGPDDFMKWLTEVFDELGLKKSINIMGMSYGSWLSFLYALRFPERLNKAVLIAHPTVLPARPGFLMRASLMMIPAGFFYKNFMRWFFEDYVNKDKTDAGKMIDIFFMISGCFKPKRLPEPTVLADEELKSIAVPALFITGENEKIYSAGKAMHRINDVAPQIKTELIPGAGHDLLAVQPELVIEKVLEFLR